MIVNVGSTNPVKIAAVEEILIQYEIFREVKIKSVDANSEVSNQPKSLEETLRGSKNRARNCFVDCNYSIGLESGLIPLVDSDTKHMNFSVCAIYNGKKYAIGFSPAFPLPASFSETIEQGKELDAVAYEKQATSNPRIGHKQGIIGVWTKGRVTRKDYLKPAIQMALIKLENPELFNF